MKSLRALFVSSASAFLVVLAGASVNACSSKDAPPASGSSGTSGGIDASLEDTGIPGEGGKDASGDGGSALPLGDLPTVDEPDVPCVTTAGLKTELFAKSATTFGGPAVTRLQALGARRFAAGQSTQGFITFDAAGTTPKFFGVSLGTTETVFTSEGTTIGAFALSTGKVDYQRYDDQGATSGAVVPVATGIAGGPAKSWVASGGGGSLVVWASGSTLSGAAISAAGALVGAPFTIATNVDAPKVAITYTGTKYAIAFASAAGIQSVARFVFADASGTVGTPTPIGTADALEPVAITPTSAGFVLVVDAGGDEHVYTVPLDTTGKVSGPARRLLGGDLPFGLASHDNDVALVVLTNDIKVGNDEGPRAPQFRPLDITGKPTGPWVCLDARIPSNLYQDMSILAEPSGGYSVVYKSPADTTMLVRVNKLGTAAP
jgi:hypothetical protein